MISYPVKCRPNSRRRSASDRLVIEVDHAVAKKDDLERDDSTGAEKGNIVPGDDKSIRRTAPIDRTAGTKG
jgi:hypothetical protein